MGATVTCGKLASAFKADSGKTYYVLFERTYEKNCYPHTPHWSCVAVGGIEQILNKVFRYASSAEGGILKGQSGDITPESYISGWLKELAEPVVFSDSRIDLRVGEGFYDPIQPSSAETAYQIILDHGRQDMVDDLSGGGACSLSLYEHAALISDLCNKPVVAAWGCELLHKA